MTFDELEVFFCDWYEAPAEAFRLPAEAVPDRVNHDLREFYLRFGQLAEQESPFAHPKSRFGPLSAQDHFVAADQLQPGDEGVVFLDENQGVFVAGAALDELMVLVEGELGTDRFPSLTPTAVPLTEMLVAAALIETIASVADRDRLVTADDTARLGAVVLAKPPRRLRTVHEPGWPFWLTPEVAAFGFDDDPVFFARRGQWRHRPPLFQTFEYEDGGVSTVGPSNPTPAQQEERDRTLAEARRRGQS